MRALEEPALQLVRQERAFLTDAELRRALGRAFENRETSAVAAAEVHLDIVTCTSHLRAVLVAIRTAGDLEQIDEATIDLLTDAVFRRLIDETSMWVGERVADAVHDWQRARRGSCTRLRDRALEVIRDVRRSPSAWYDARSFDEPDQWLNLLCHREPAVRGVAVSDGGWRRSGRVRPWSCPGLPRATRRHAIRPLLDALPSRARLIELARHFGVFVPQRGTKAENCSALRTAIQGPLAPMRSLVATSRFTQIASPARRSSRPLCGQATGR